MAQARLINKCISLSEKVADLKDDTARLLYTWIIPHTDDFGLIVASPRKIKATVFPMNDCTVESIGIHLEDMVKVGLIKRITHNSKTYFQVIGHEKKQTFKKDRNPQTILEYELVKSSSDNWQKGFDIIDGIQMEDIGRQMEQEDKLSKEKIREEKRIEGKESMKGKPFVSTDVETDDIPF